LSTCTATTETRPRRAAWISPVSRAASAGWEADVQIAEAAAAWLTVALAVSVRNGLNATPTSAAVAALINLGASFPGILHENPSWRHAGRAV